MSTYTVSLEPASEDDLALFAQWWNNCKIADGCRKEVDPLPVEDNIERFRIWCHEESDSGFGYAIRNQEGLCVGCISAWVLPIPSVTRRCRSWLDRTIRGMGMAARR